MALTFNKRQQGYKEGIGLLLFGVVVFCVGFATPYWNVNTCKDYYKQYEGLWQSCWSPVEVHKFKSYCVSRHLDADGWFAVVQAMQTMSLAGHLIAVSYFFVVNFVFSNTNTRIARAGEFTALFSVVLGVIGLIVYGIEQTKIDQDIKPEKSLCGEHCSNTVLRQQPVFWSFYLDSAGLVIIFVAVLVIDVSSKPCRLDKTVTRYRAVPQRVTVSCPENAVNSATLPLAFAPLPDYVTAPLPYVVPKVPASGCHAGQ